MFKDIDVQQMIHLQKEQELTLIDVRSPSEYKESSIPGSINIPIFNDEERAEIGTIYKQVNVEAAKERGLEIVSAKLPAFIREFRQIKGGKLVYCWRGGMRSKTSATVTDLMGIKVYRLLGGLNAYRRWVVDSLNSFQINPKAFVINGLTGTGKTAILKALHSKGYPVIDLEGLASHRGSIFGQVGLEPRNQKMFDALLLKELVRTEQSKYVLFEAESKRIGKVALPDFLLKKKQQGQQLFIELPMEERVKHILEEYEPGLHQQEYIDAFQKIKNRIHTPIAKQIEEDLLSRDYPQAIRLLLEYYYDPRYQHTSLSYPEENIKTIKARTIEEATDLIEDILEKEMIVAR
ncbi:tRNA 2-selenouridine(34) synthase MnmH [Bacillus sp. PS06]|uniref:tRNA 2-selenouridine(34) synthase MnmH n=1 Tax=Bacillus sp. PS06 TaxID=2764176 RepID=UPI001781C6B2|nr:tRNA 2-selenouridine(34) synthase MnmH [Bacillus sp. PS06]MBD8067372.1 tRNA 2-selenouridine(34) synthase MnmH [Bacillus sp. PS06]